jgi:hypothetical protein
LPGVPYTLSHELIPIVREYRRASTTAVDASCWQPSGFRGLMNPNSNYYLAIR